MEKLKPQTLNIVILKASNCMILYLSSIIKGLMLYRVQICIVHITICWDEQWFTWLIVQKTQSNPPTTPTNQRLKNISKTWHLLSWCLKRMERCLWPGRGNSQWHHKGLIPGGVGSIVVVVVVVSIHSSERKVWDPPLAVTEYWSREFCVIWILFLTSQLLFYVP